MKNLMVYINPRKSFGTKEVTKLVEIQIENSLSLGWKPEDILLYTNFPWEYNILWQYSKVKSIVLPDELYCSFRPLSTKTLTVAYLLSKKQINTTDVYWVHDLDAFQLEPLDVNIDGFVAGFTDYGWGLKWSLGSYFVKHTAEGLFMRLADTINETKLEDERAMVKLTNENALSGFKKLNITYNFGMRKIGHNYKIADKPLRVVHFHPQSRGREVLDSFMYGKNKLGFPLMNSRLIMLFKKYGFE